ncbi:hypothetical protein AB834_06760 [PVC group bacterium (ex Bugula neritina AB1)]|nr:hypothetical protein AB834_06760 [PVC group bacterium (ex Bugula neritina AB1)]
MVSLFRSFVSKFFQTTFLFILFFTYFFLDDVYSSWVTVKDLDFFKEKSAIFPLSFLEKISAVFFVEKRALWVKEKGVWKKAFYVSTGEQILSAVLFSEKKAFVLTNKNLYLYEKKIVRTVYETRGSDQILNVWTDESGSELLLNTVNSLYSSKDEGINWKEVKYPGVGEKIFKICGSQEEKFILSERGVFHLLKNEIPFVLESFRVVGGDSKDGEDDKSLTKEEGDLFFLQKYKSMRKVLFWDQGSRSLCYSSPKGLRGMRHKNSDFWEPLFLPQDGLPKIEDIYDLCLGEEGEGLWVSGAKGVFFLNQEDHFWTRRQEGLPFLKVLGMQKMKGKIFCSLERGVYSWEKDEKKTNLFESFYSKKKVEEPTVQSVQKKAIEYADVAKSKIDQMFMRAQKKAYWPKVSLSFGTDRSENFNAYSNGRVIGLPIEHDSDWKIDLSWDFGDLIYTSDEASIEMRSKMMVQLREDILEEVTRIYFERKREQVSILFDKEMSLYEKKLKELRVEELTAKIDAYTCGWFSREIKRKKN